MARSIIMSSIVVATLWGAASAMAQDQDQSGLACNNLCRRWMGMSDAAQPPAVQTTLDLHPTLPPVADVPALTPPKQSEQRAAMPPPKLARVASVPHAARALPLPPMIPPRFATTPKAAPLLPRAATESPVAQFRVVAAVAVPPTADPALDPAFDPAPSAARPAPPLPAPTIVVANRSESQAPAGPAAMLPVAVAPAPEVPVTVMPRSTAALAPAPAPATAAQNRVALVFPPPLDVIAAVMLQAPLRASQTP